MNSPTIRTVVAEARYPSYSGFRLHSPRGVIIDRQVLLTAPHQRSKRQRSHQTSKHITDYNDLPAIHLSPQVLGLSLKMLGDYHRPSVIG